MQSSRHILVFHSHCPDGAAAAATALRAQRKAHLVYGQHEKIDQQVMDAAQHVHEGGWLWIADICCSRAALEAACQTLVDRGGRLGVYDHHISSSWLKDFQLPGALKGEIHFDVQRCGARIFFEAQLTDNNARLAPLTDFIDLTNDRDLWLNKKPASVDLSMLHTIYGDERYIQRFIKNPSTELSPEEKALVAYERENLQRRTHRMLSEIKIKKDAAGHRYGVLVGEGKSSDVCNAALEKLDLAYVCMVDFNSGRVSLRSRDDTFNCAEFALKKGGGGHARAGGFPIPAIQFDLHG